MHRYPCSRPMVGSTVAGLGMTPVAGALTVALSGPSSLEWPTWLTLLPLILMVPLRRTADGIERQSELRHELGLSRQREQVGRDVHDILGHSLTVIAVKTELVSKLLARDPERARTELDDIWALTPSSLTEVRATVTQLQTPHVGPQLTAAETAAGVRTELPAQLPNFDDAHSHLLAWCLPEAATNVVRHAHASWCSITITETGITVTDDGVGCSGVDDGNGLRGMGFG